MITYVLNQTHRLYGKQLTNHKLTNNNTRVRKRKEFKISMVMLLAI